MGRGTGLQLRPRSAGGTRPLPLDKGGGPAGLGGPGTSARVSARSASTPESWDRFNHEILQRADRERLATVSLRTLIDDILRDTAEDLRLQCDTVNLAFERRCEELEDVRHKLQFHLHKVRAPRAPGLPPAPPTAETTPTTGPRPPRPSPRLGPIHPLAITPT